jgi:hypothetical protein
MLSRSAEKLSSQGIRAGLGKQHHLLHFHLQRLGQYGFDFGQRAAGAGRKHCVGPVVDHACAKRQRFQFVFIEDYRRQFVLVVEQVAYASRAADRYAGIHQRVEIAVNGAFANREGLGDHAGGNRTPAPAQKLHDLKQAFCPAHSLSPPDPLRAIIQVARRAPIAIRNTVDRTLSGASA